VQQQKIVFTSNNIYTLQPSSLVAIWITNNRFLQIKLSCWRNDARSAGRVTHVMQFSC